MDATGPLPASLLNPDGTAEGTGGGPVVDLTGLPASRGGAGGAGRDVAVALRTVLLHLLTDVFSLHPEETMWASEHLREILAPTEALAPRSVALAVRHELLTGYYSDALDRAESADGPGAGTGTDPLCAQATTEDWAAGIMNMVLASYVLRPMAESSMQGALTGLLRELGVGDPRAPRPAAYLPSDIRERAAARTAGQRQG